jgi:hypothetical protein
MMLDKRERAVLEALRDPRAVEPQGAAMAGWASAGAVQALAWGTFQDGGGAPGRWHIFRARVVLAAMVSAGVLELATGRCSHPDCEEVHLFVRRAVDGALVPGGRRMPPRAAFTAMRF